MLLSDVDNTLPARPAEKMIAETLPIAANRAASHG